jgi:hypothetical protein
MSNFGDSAYPPSCFKNVLWCFFLLVSKPRGSALDVIARVAAFSQTCMFAQWMRRPCRAVTILSSDPLEASKLPLHRSGQFMCISDPELSSPILPPLLPLHLPSHGISQPPIQIPTLLLPINLHALRTTQTHSALVFFSTTHFFGHLARLLPLLVAKRAVALVEQQSPLTRERKDVDGLYGLGAQELVCGW